MSRLSIDMTDQQHQSLKALAALQGKTIKQYALERLLPVETDEEQALLQLSALLKSRVAEGLSGKVSRQSISDILDEEMAKERDA